ncbi:MAG TPA: hypothetical protein VGR65_00255 [Casimicrobiaceae bacterium]|jgi:hypothetical protein|nr:hypothetical protein [Casimicrobiaceae bacterium]
MLVNPQRRPARPASRSVAVDPPTLLQFVVLSMLLHVLLIVLFGNPVGGSARRSDGSWGPLDVTLRRLSPEPGSAFKLAPGAETSAPGVSLRRRSAGAADMNRLQRVPEPADASQPAQQAAPTAEEAATPAQPAPGEALPRLNRTAPEELDKPLTPSVVSPAKIERIAPASIERELAPRLELPPRAVPMAPAAPLERVAPPQIERDVAPPVELPPRAVPMAPAAPLERVAPPQIERDVAPPVELPPRAVPMAPAAPLERVAPARIERELAPAVEVPAARRAPAEADTQPPRAAPAPAAVPRSLPGETAPPAERAAPPVAPARPQAQPVAPLPASRFGTPNADEEIFKPRRDVGTSPSEAPRIDLDAARKKAAREVVREGSGSRGVFTIPSPPPPEKKTKEAMAMEKALKPDCRTAYASMGLLAVPVLVASAIAADGSCRW